MLSRLVAPVEMLPMRDLFRHILSLVVCGLLCCWLGYDRGYQEGLSEKAAFYRGLERIMGIKAE